MPESREMDAAAGPARYLAFRGRGRLYGVPIQDVAEVARVPPLAKVPQAPVALLGLANLRGSVLPVASLSGLLGLPAADITGMSRAIIVNAAAPYAIVVDAVEAVVTVEAEQVETRASEIGATDGERLLGVFVADHEPVRILDLVRLLEGVFVPQPRAQTRAGSKSRAALPSVARHEAEEGLDLLITFGVANQEYGLHFSDAEEVITRPEAVTALPGSDAQLTGLVPYRENLLPMLSVRSLLGLPANIRTDREKVLVTRIGGIPVGLLVDEIKQSVAVDRSRMESVPAVMLARIGGEAKVQAIYRTDAGSIIPVLVPDRLLREDTMRRLSQLPAAAERNPSISPSAPEGELQLLVFRLGEEEFGLPLEAIDEVAPVPEKMTRVPRAPKFLEGVISLRGEVLPVIDQRKRFEMPPSERLAGRRLVVVRSGQHRAGLIVDSVSEVLRTTPSSVEPAPGLAGETVRLVRSVINLEREGRLVLLLDPSELLSRAERSLLEKFRKNTARPSS